MQQYAHERIQPALNATGIAAAFFGKAAQRQRQGALIEAKNRHVAPFFDLRRPKPCLAVKNAPMASKSTFLAMLAF